ncbi:MAG: CBS domain-containing protein [Nitrososphaerota archaeon]|jgi:predicted transcriptional regulator|nr:CBS domain-containing protein [Nitrososphaerota archaeon]
MVKDPISIGPDEPVEQARRLFRINRIGGVPVMDDGKLVGVFTLVDLKKVRPGRTLSTKVKEVMTKDPLVGHPNDTLATIYDTMSRKAVGRIPIVADNDATLLGLVSFSDLKDISRLHSFQGAGSAGDITKLVCPSCGHGLPMPVSRFASCKYCGTTSYLKV